MKMIKKLIVFALILVMSINTFAAVIFGDEGASFVTKEAFENLKNDFNTQVDNYNRSLEEKVDGAIAAYLFGTQLSKKESIVGSTEVKNSDQYIYGRRKNFGGIQKQIWNDSAFQYITWGVANTSNFGRYPLKESQTSGDKNSDYVLHNQALTPLFSNRSDDVIGYVFNNSGVVERMMLDDNITFSGSHFGVAEMGDGATYSWRLEDGTVNASTREINVLYADLFPSVGRFKKANAQSISTIRDNVNDIIVPQSFTSGSSEGSWWDDRGVNDLFESYNERTMFVHTTGSQYKVKNIYNKADIPIYAYLNGETELETFSDPLDDANFKDPDTNLPYPFDIADNAYDTQLIANTKDTVDSWKTVLIGKERWDRATSPTDELEASVLSLMIPKFKLKNKTTVAALRPTIKGKNETEEKFNNLSQFKNGLFPYKDADGVTQYPHFYGGVPLFTRDAMGQATFKIKFDGDAGNKIRVRVKQYEFPNDVYSSTSPAWNEVNPMSDVVYKNELCLIATGSNAKRADHLDLNLDEEYTLHLKDLEKDTPYFLRFSEVNGDVDTGEGGVITYLSDFTYQGD